MRRKLRSHAILALASLFLFLAVGLSPAAAKGGPVALTISPDGARLYLAWMAIRSGRSTSAISVIDAAALQVTATFPVKDNPDVYTLTPSPDGSRLYLSEYGAVDGIDPATGHVTATIKTGPWPLLIAPSPDGQRLYVATADPYEPGDPRSSGGGLTVIDSAANKALTLLEVGQMTQFAAVSPDGRRIYALGCNCPGDSVLEAATLTVIDVGTLQVVASRETGRFMHGAALSPDGKRLYVTSMLSSLAGTNGHWDPRVDIYDTATLQVAASVKVSDEKYVFADRPVVSPDGKRVYLTMANSPDSIHVLDAQTLQFTGSLTLPGGAWLMAMSPDGERLFTASGTADSATITAIDPATLKPMAALKLALLATAP
jgi:DNA-binding beta-propeller fold protein YncE